MNDDKKHIRQAFWRMVFTPENLQNETGIKHAANIILDAVRSENRAFLDNLPNRQLVLDKTHLAVLHGVEKIKSGEMLDCLESIGIGRQLLLGTAVVQARLEVARYLLAEGKVNIYDGYGRLLTDAAENKDVEMVRIIMQAGFDLYHLLNKNGISNCSSDFFYSFVNQVSSILIGDFYKYITFDQSLKEQTGQVYKDLCHKLRGLPESYPDAEWLSQHHSCPPIWYGWDGAALAVPELRQRLLG